MALTLTEMRGFDFEYALEPRAVQLYVRDSGYGFLSHVSYVTGTDAMYAPVNASRFRESFQRRYEELCQTEFDVVSSGGCRPRSRPTVPIAPAP